MATIGANRSKSTRSVSGGSVRRVSPLKPGLRGARNWATAQMRSASYSRKSFIRLTGSILAVLLFISFIGLWLGGFLPDVKRASDDFTRGRLMSMGFVVSKVDVVGEGRLREADVHAALGVRPGDYLFAMDMADAKRRVESLSWVEQAVVRRLWPDRIVVQIVERRPFALWQNQGGVKVVDVSGVVITAAKPVDFSGLPLVVGPHAADHAADIYKAMHTVPQLAARSSAMIFHETQRWDIEFDDGRIRVKLPAGDMNRSLAMLQKLQDQHQLLDRALSVVDLRLSDRITLQPAIGQRA